MHDAQRARPNRRRSAAAASLIVAVLVSIVGVVPTRPVDAAAQPVNFAAVADAYVKSTSPSTRYGTATTLRTRGGSTIYRTFVQFVVSGQTSALRDRRHS
jgi:hypothetical protein